MKVLTYTSYKEHYALYTKIQGSIAVNSCQVGLAQKYIILLSNASLTVHKVSKCSKCTSVNNTEFISFTLSEGTYSIDEFNAKIKVATLKQRKGLDPPQIKDLRLVMPKDYLFMADNTIFYALGIQSNYLEKATLIRSTLPLGSYKTSLDTSPSPKILSLRCKQINKIKNEIDGQPSNLLTFMHVSNYNATFSPIHLVFLELKKPQPHLGFKILDENNNEVIPRLS